MRVQYRLMNAQGLTKVQHDAATGWRRQGLLGYACIFHAGELQPRSLARPTGT